MSETEDPNIDRLREEMSEKRERLRDLKWDSDHVHPQAELDALSREIHEDTVELVGREMLNRQQREGELLKKSWNAWGSTGKLTRPSLTLATLSRLRMASNRTGVITW